MSPAARSRGTRPARTSELLPDPEGPTTAENPCSSDECRQCLGVVLPTEERRRIGLVERPQALVGVDLAEAELGQRRHRRARPRRRRRHASRVAVAQSVRRTASVQASTKSAIVGIPVGRVDRRRPLQHVSDRRGHVGPVVAQRRHRLLELATEQLADVVALERWTPGEQLPDHHAQRVLVARRRGDPVTCLFRARVERRPRRSKAPDGTQVGAVGGDAEVD